MSLSSAQSLSTQLRDSPPEQGRIYTLTRRPSRSSLMCGHTLRKREKGALTLPLLSCCSRTNNAELICRSFARPLANQGARALVVCPPSRLICRPSGFCLRPKIQSKTNAAAPQRPWSRNGRGVACWTFSLLEQRKGILYRLAGRAEWTRARAEKIKGHLVNHHRSFSARKRFA